MSETSSDQTACHSADQAEHSAQVKSILVDSTPQRDLSTQAAIEAMMPIAEDDSDRYVLAVHWLHDRGWSRVAHLAPGSDFAQHGFISPQRNMIAVVGLDGSTPPDLCRNDLNARLRQLGLGVTADTVRHIKFRSITIDVSGNRVVERSGSRSWSAPLHEGGSATAEGSQSIGAGRHPPATGNYNYRKRGNSISVAPVSLSVPGAHPLDRDDQWMLDAAFATVEARGMFDAEEVVQLKRAAGTIAIVTPDALGLFGSGGYSGLNSTSLASNLGHRTRARAFAFELLGAAKLAERASVSDDGAHVLQLRPGYERVDFGVRFDLTGMRRSVEADVLITGLDGSRRGVDMKFTSGRSGHPTRLSAPYLDGIRAVLDRKELDSFHILHNTWMRPSNRERLREMQHVGVAIASHSFG